MNHTLTAGRVPVSITQHPRMQEIVICMPAQVEQIVRAAFACKPEERQRAYEQLKAFYAAQSEYYLELGPRHYETMMRFLDWVLPELPPAAEGEEE